MTKSKNKLPKGNFKDKELFEKKKTESRAYCIVWCDNFIYLHKFYDVHLWALNLSVKGLFFNEKYLTSLC